MLDDYPRGPIVDEDALLAALRSGAIAGAGLDVYDEEPLPGGHPLRAAPRTVLTRYLGLVTDEEQGDNPYQVSLHSSGDMMFLAEQTTRREPVHGSNQAA